MILTGGVIECRIPVNEEDSKLGSDMLRFITGIDELETPDQVLDGLHEVTSKASKVNVLVAGLMPIRWCDWSGVEKGKTIFLHKSGPDGWWEEYFERTQKHPGPGLALAQLSIAPFTMSEMMRMLDPLGVDRWPCELAMKYGIRDYFTCPVGGRWTVTYWSRSVLSNRLTPEGRTILFMGATFTAIRLQRLIGVQTSRLGSAAALTARELAVLRHASLGHQLREIAELIGLGEETVRTHLKKAQVKLGAQNRVQAVAQAIRLNLIP